MKLKLVDLDPHLLKRTSPVDYDLTFDVALADALQLRCPACHWAGRRTGEEAAHAIILWGDRARWRFVGHGVSDLSLTAGRASKVSVTAGPCHAQFDIRGGKVDFY